MQTETVQKAAAALITGLIGCGIGWGANALTLSGRVDAIEQSQLRIEALLHQVLIAKVADAAK